MDVRRKGVREKTHILRIDARLRIDCKPRGSERGSLHKIEAFCSGLDQRWKRCDRFFFSEVHNVEIKRQLGAVPNDLGVSFANFDIPPRVGRPERFRVFYLQDELIFFLQCDNLIHIDAEVFAQLGRAITVHGRHHNLKPLFLLRNLRE